MWWVDWMGSRAVRAWIPCVSPFTSALEAADRRRPTGIRSDGMMATVVNAEPAFNGGELAKMHTLLMNMA